MRPLGSATGGSTWFLRANPRPRRDVREAGAHVFKFQGRSDFGVAIFVSWNLRDPQAAIDPDESASEAIGDWH